MEPEETRLLCSLNILSLKGQDCCAFARGGLNRLGCCAVSNLSLRRHDCCAVSKLNLKRHSYGAFAEESLNRLGCCAVSRGSLKRRMCAMQVLMWDVRGGRAPTAQLGAYGPARHPLLAAVRLKSTLAAVPGHTLTSSRFFMRYAPITACH